MGWISFNEISLWDAFMILVFISGHLFEYEKQPIIRLRWLNIYPLLHMLSFKVVVSYVEVEGFFLFDCVFFFPCCVFFSSWQEEGRRLVNQEIRKYPREKLFSGFFRIYMCARHHWIAVMFSIFLLLFLVFTLLFQLFEFVFTNLCLFLRKFKFQEGKKNCIILEKYYFRTIKKGNTSTALEI